MELAGWQSWDSMRGYVQVQARTVEDSYREAMDEIRKSGSAERGHPRELSLEEFSHKECG